MFKARQKFCEPSLYFYKRHRFQTAKQYSSTGCTYVLKAAIKDEILMDSKHRKIKLSFLCALTHISHTRTVVRECCKGDDASQWRNPNFDPPPRSNPISDSHKSWQRWLHRGPLHPVHLCKSLSRYVQGFHFRACVTLRTKRFLVRKVFFRFLGFLQLTTAKVPGRILTQNMPKYAVPRKDVPFRGREHKI